MNFFNKNFHWILLGAVVIGFSVLLSLTVSIKIAIADFYKHHTLIAENKSWKDAYESLEEKHTDFIVNSMEMAATTRDTETLLMWAKNKPDSITKEKYLNKYREVNKRLDAEKAKNIEIEMQ